MLFFFGGECIRNRIHDLLFVLIFLTIVGKNS